MAPDAFLDQCQSTSATSYGWFGSPRVSFSIDLPSASDDKPPTSSVSAPPPSNTSSSVSLLDFEFCPEDSVSMFPADELISGGRLVPLHLRPNHPEIGIENVSESLDLHEDEEEEGMVTVVEENGVTSVSPKAPKCSSRWKEFLGLKKAVVLNNNKQDQIHKLTKSGTGSGSRSLKHFLHRNSKPTSPISNDSSSSSVPLLLGDSDSNVDPTPAPLASAVPCRRSVEREKSQKQAQIPCPKNPSTKFRVSSSLKPSRKIPDPTRPLPDHPVVRSGRSQMRHATESTISTRGVSVDSPRMNSSGKIVFQNLGRSSSSPSTYGSGPRAKSRAMERSYSSSVRITPVLNVPVCSLRGSSKSVFGMFSQQKKDSKKELSSSSSSSSSGNNRSVCKIEKQ